MTISEGQVEANGLTFGYLTEGEGPLALLLHGFPDTAWGWRHLIPELAGAGYRVVAPFLRGYAPTEVPSDGLYQSGAVASDAIALHEVLGGDGDAVIVGHDWGAIATYAAAGSAPERWAKVVVAAVPPLGTVANAFFSYDQLRKSWYMFFFQSPLADLAVPMDDLAFIDRLWADWSPGYDAAEDLAHVKDALRDPANLTAALGYYRATLGAGAKSPEYDAVEAAAALPLAQPTLYLHGVDDGCMGVELIDDSVRTALPHPDSRVELVADAGHFLQLEQPAVVNRLILDFLTP
ncbi:alpha/beta hydrolase [Aquihabitans sp. G128]|uniref:alpha/beta fold hydrolase n=1 Tax=Aquihabitans sp. G128 TaxID=2849779 RepID=UPI001C21CC5E|nr:alpha/beta hydrolase [Aquihabitans sp. G128]QXC61197.1 alpha/beta hydrolase [Aquihabitans sp. G128]